MFKRNIKSELEELINRSPISLLIGARQTGKSTLMKQIAAERGIRYITLDDLNFLAGAKSDPMGFIQSIEKPIIIDEVQRAPELFLAMKHDVDQNRHAGRYILTGSANPLLIPRLGDSLVGRMEMLDLYPLSQGEIVDYKEHFIDALFSSAPLSFSSLAPQSRKELYTKIVKGGYPSVLNLSDADRESWFQGYITTILYRDVTELSQVTALSEFPRLLQLLATRASTLVNVSEVSRSLTMPNTTLHRYISLLQILFIINFQQPWSSNFSKRLIKSPKMYLIDTGLLAYLLGADVDRVITTPQLAGAMLENFVVSELLKQVTWSKIHAQLFHFRTSTGVEVDIILEDRAGRVVGIEIKASDTVTAKDFKGLKYLKEELKDNFIKGIVLYTGSEVVPFGDNLMAVPIQGLWSPLRYN